MKLIIAHLTNGGINGGSVKYLDELVPLLLREPGVERLRVFVPSAYRIPEESSECFQSIPKWDHLSGYPSIQAAVKRDSFDAAFSSNTRWVEFRGLPTMVMVRNMEPLLPASRLTPILARVKNILRLWETRRAVLNSDRVVGVSKFVCEHLINRWRINPEKVALVYHGVGAGLQSNGIPPAMLRDLKQPFALSAGSIQPYRGYEDVLVALGKLRDQGKCLPLVLAGGVPVGCGEGYHKQLQTLVEKLGLGKWMIWAGELTRSEIMWCFENCSVFVSTSRVEACPNILLEALSGGCLVVAADAKPMPEFCRDAAEYYPVGDSSALAAAVARAIGCGTAERTRRSARAREIASEFTWQRTAKATLRQLGEMVGTKK